MSRVDRAGFTRRWGIHLFVDRGAPWVSLGLHFDWHTPTLDLYLGHVTIQIGRNNWDGEERLSVRAMRRGPHTDQCSHFRLVHDTTGTHTVAESRYHRTLPDAAATPEEGAK